MKFRRRAFMHLAVGAAALPAVPGISRAQAYPSRTARIIVGFPAGGATDIQARLMGEWLSTSGHRVGNGASYEVYRNTPENAAPNDLRTELYLAIED